MKKIYRWIFTISLVICLVSSDINLSNAAIQIPEKVRIGLFYGSTALSGFTASAEKGIQLGYVKDNIFTVLYEEATGNAITVRKDTYYVRNGSVSNGTPTVNGLKEYNPTGLQIPEGEKIGPFHIRIGETYNDLNTVNAQLQILKQNGIAAYAVFIDSWQIWAGYYTDMNAAQTDITNNFEPKLGAGICFVVEPGSDPKYGRITALGSNGDTLLIFGNDTSVFQIRPKAENSPYILKINNKKYRGDLEVRRFTGSDMTLINILPLEQYLYGVVPAEIESSAPAEALKAQAVAARTYTLNSIVKHKNYDFNLCSTDNCQVYKGFESEPASLSTNNAVDSTAGKVITYNGALAKVYYSSSSGGMTEDSKNVWSGDLPYLRSVEDKYESGNSLHYNWVTTLTAVKIKEIMEERKYYLGDILNITITKKSSAGRTIELIIKGTNGERVYVKEGCRTVFSLLYSQLYTITTDADVSVGRQEMTTVKTQLGGKKVMTADGLKTVATNGNKVTVLGASGQTKTIPTIPTTYVFTGKGWGHAVGMSQEGAKGMAKNGFKYDEILKHYFIGTKIG